ncbi:unnamed protein product, partial [Closterium sp. Naga37s-1]
MATREYETHTFFLPNWPTPFEATATGGKEAVLELLRNPANAEGFVLFPREENSGAGRINSTPETATYWEEAHRAAVAMFGEGTVVIPLILSSDATMLSGNERTKVWAVYISIANIPLHRRWQECGKLLLAMLPFPPSQMSLAEKTALFQAAMKIVLVDLIVASHTGMAATDPNGVERFVVPLLFSYVADYPETCKVSCTQQLGSVRPCSLCYVLREHLRDMDREAAEMRTVENQEGLLEDPAEAAKYATMSVPFFVGLQLQPHAMGQHVPDDGARRSACNLYRLLAVHPGFAAGQRHDGRYQGQARRHPRSKMWQLLGERSKLHGVRACRCHD